MNPIDEPTCCSHAAISSAATAAGIGTAALASLLSPGLAEHDQHAAGADPRAACLACRISLRPRPSG